MSPTQGLWHPIFRACLQDQVYGSLDIDPEPGGDIERLCSIPSPHDGTDNPFIGQNSLKITLPRADSIMASQESAFRASNGWAVQEEPNMRGKADPSRMGDTLAIENPGIRGLADFFCEIEENRAFSKAQ
jgi:hypothetical protein